MKKLIALALLLGCGGANASIVTWNVNAVFDDGGILTGSFEYDEATSSVIAQDLSTAGGSLQFHAGTWEVNNFSNETSGQVLYLKKGTIDFLRVSWDEPTLTGLTEVAIGASVQEKFQLGPNPIRWVESGTLTAVPIPAAVWLFGSGLGLLGWFRRKSG